MTPLSVRFRWAWEVLTTGDIYDFQQRIARSEARIKILENYLNPKYGCVISPLNNKPGELPESLPFPHTGPTRTPFDS